jgi:hypothetical protein
MVAVPATEAEATQQHSRVLQRQGQTILISDLPVLVVTASASYGLIIGWYPNWWLLGATVGGGGSADPDAGAGLGREATGVPVYPAWCMRRGSLDDTAAARLGTSQL